MWILKGVNHFALKWKETSVGSAKSNKGDFQGKVHSEPKQKKKVQILLILKNQAKPAQEEEEQQCKMQKHEN